MHLNEASLVASRSVSGLVSLMVAYFSPGDLQNGLIFGITTKFIAVITGKPPGVVGLTCPDQAFCMLLSHIAGEADWESLVA